MKDRLWQRVRRHKNPEERGRDPDAVASVPTPIPAIANPPAGNVEDDSMLPLLGDLTATGEKAAEYADWAERMKAKRVEKVDRVRQLNDDDPPPGPTYWSADAVWEESRRLEGDNRAVVHTRIELLSVLGLDGNASDAEIVASYRRQAKEHHPDRFPNADEATRRYHMEQMQRVSAAYRALLPSQRS